MFVLLNLSGVELRLLLRFLRNESNHPVLATNSTGDVIVMAKLIDMYTHTHTKHTRTHNDGSDNQPNTLTHKICKGRKEEASEIESAICAQHLTPLALLTD